MATRPNYSLSVACGLRHILLVHKPAEIRSHNILPLFVQLQPGHTFSDALFDLRSRYNQAPLEITCRWRIVNYRLNTET